MRNNNLKIRKALLTTIWVALLDEPLKQEEVVVIPAKKIFGEEARHLRPLIPIKWRGKTEVLDENEKHLKLEPGIQFKLLTEDVTKPTLKEIMEFIRSKIDSITKNPFDLKEEEKTQSLPFSVIDVTLKNALPEDFKKTSVLDVLNLLVWPEENLTNYDPDVYRKIDLMRNDFMFNLSSLKDCFMSIHPKAVLIVRYNIHNKYVRASTLEAVSMIAICFVAYSTLLRRLAKWESEVFQLCKGIKKEENFLGKVIDRINELVKYNYQSSSLLQFHMSYVSSSAVAQNFYQTFVSLSGLKEFHESLTTKLRNSERILNYLIDLHQFEEIQRLRKGE